MVAPMGLEVVVVVVLVHHCLFAVVAFDAPRRAGRAIPPERRPIDRANIPRAPRAWPAFGFGVESACQNDERCTPACHVAWRLAVVSLAKCTRRNDNDKRRVQMDTPIHDGPGP